MRTFQTILLAIFGFFIVAGVIALATFGKFKGGTSVQAQAVIWGTLPEEVVDKVTTDYNNKNNNALAITYKRFPEGSFESDLINALAAGKGPDAIIFTDDQLVGLEDKLYTIPFTSFPERTFRDTYTQGSELFLTRTGVLGLPIAVDPMVVYWNRTLFNAERIAQPPKYWDELVGMGEKLTKTDENFNIQQSVIALGEYSNIEHAKEIIATLIMQAGNPITLRDATGRIGVIMGENLGLPEAPADSALRFYTEFANPVKPVYSWNRSLPSSKSAFVRGDLALYLGFGSELLDIQQQNPNLNFDLAPVPQVRDSTLTTTFGRMYGIALVKQTKNTAGAFKAITILAGKEAEGYWAQNLGLAPARRDLLGTTPKDPYQAIFYKEALIASSFLDPAPEKSDVIFKNLVGDITSGREPVSRAVSSASGQLRQLFK